EGMGAHLYIECRSVASLVHRCVALFGVEPRAVEHATRELARRPEIGKGHRKKRLTRMTVPPEGGVVDLQEAMVFDVEDERRKGISLEEHPIALLGLADRYIPANIGLGRRPPPPRTAHVRSGSLTDGRWRF